MNISYRAIGLSGSSIVLLLALAVLTYTPVLQAAVEFDSCTIGNDTASMEAQCASVEVPVDRENPSSATINLHIAKVSASNSNTKLDPITLLAGGPGQAATDSYPALAFAFRHVQRDRDIYLIDQRGTGLSEQLNCEHSTEEKNLEFDAARIEKVSQQCLDALDVDPRFFTTSVAVQDLDAVRELLGIEQWNLYGISYGTRVALHYLRRFPQRVRTMTLDAVVPPDISLGPEIALTAQGALEQLFTRCELDEGCNEAFPSLAQKTKALLERLTASPVEVQYENVTTGQLQQMLFDAKHLAVTLRLMSYSAYGNAILPSMLFDAYENNNLAPLARQANIQSSNLDKSLSAGMHNAVICTEDAPYIEDITDRTPYENSYLGTDLIDGLAANCKPWPAGVIDEDFKTPVVSDVPTLIMSGTADPITPPEFGESVAKHLSNSLHIVNEHQAHMQIATGCIASIFAEFVSLASVDDLRTECLERIRAPAFFVDANGPLP